MADLPASKKHVYLTQCAAHSQQRELPSAISPAILHRVFLMHGTGILLYPLMQRRRAHTWSEQLLTRYKPLACVHCNLWACFHLLSFCFHSAIAPKKLAPSRDASCRRWLLLTILPFPTNPQQWWSSLSAQLTNTTRFASPRPHSNQSSAANLSMSNTVRVGLLHHFLAFRRNTRSRAGSCQELLPSPPHG